MAGRNVQCKQCGSYFNAESVDGCPICALGESRPMTVSNNKRVSIRRRGKAVRGTPKAAQILELASRHSIPALLKMLDGEVKQSTVYKVIKESTPTSDLLRMIANYLDMIEECKRGGQRGIKADVVYIWLPPDVIVSIRRGRASQRRLTQKLESMNICYSIVSDAQLKAMVLCPTQIHAVGL